MRFAISNASERTVHIDSVRLASCTDDPWATGRLVFDPSKERLIPADLAKDTANILYKRIIQRRPLELVPGDAVGYSFELVRLANTLKSAGHSDKVRMTLDVSDRLGRVHRCPFDVDTDLWAYTQEQDGSGI